MHASGIPWNDPSGERLRAWLGMEPEVFYDESRIAIVPMGLCYPGRLPSGGDAPPRPECAPLWHARLRAAMPEIRLTLLVGSYALAHDAGPRPGGRSRCAVARPSAARLPAAAPVLAHPGLGAAQPLVRRRTPAGAAGPAGGGGPAEAAEPLEIHLPVQHRHAGAGDGGADRALAGLAAGGEDPARPADLDPLLDLER